MNVTTYGIEKESLDSMLVEAAGGETVRFKQRPLVGAPAPGDREPVIL